MSEGERTLLNEKMRVNKNCALTMQYANAATGGGDEV
jgi:hypothetical protein